MQKVLEPIQKERFTQSTIRQASIQEKNGPSLENDCQTSTSAKSLQRKRTSPTIKESDKAAFHFPAEEWVLPAASTKELEEREFVVDSGASMHIVCKRDPNSAALETMRTSRSPTTVTTVVLAIGPAVKNHISAEMARELIATYQTV